MINKKIQKYVDFIFADIPYSRKAKEMQEEITSNLQAHYEDNISNGMTENEAYQSAIDSLGNIDELLKELIPEENLQQKINRYKKKRATCTAISTALYMTGVAALIILPALTELINSELTEVSAIIGLCILFEFAIIATGITIYIKKNVPQEIENYVKPGKKMKLDINIDTSTKNGKLIEALASSFWTFVVIIYFIVSFATHAWYITWLIFLAGNAAKKCLEALLSD